MSQSDKRITSMRADGVALSRRVFLGGTLIGATALAGSIPIPAEAQYGSGGGASSGAGAGGGAGGGAGARSGAAGGGAGRAKEAKSAARYQDKPNGDQRGGRCAHFRAPNACQIVEGQISPNGWCRHFKAAG